MDDSVFQARYQRVPSAWRRCCRRAITVAVAIAGVLCAAAQVAHCAPPASDTAPRVALSSTRPTDDPPKLEPPVVVDGEPVVEPEPCEKCSECLDSFWTINTRCLPTIGCGNSAEFNPKVSRYGCKEGWSPSTLEEFLADRDPNSMTVFYIHGNVTSHDGAVMVTKQLMHRLPAKLPSGRRLRLVQWSWPSNYDLNNLRDKTQAAGARAASESYYLGRLVTLMNPDEPIMFIGYSFGARITTGMFHLIAGSQLGGRRLNDEFAKSETLTHGRMRAVLLAAAIDVDWLVPGHFHGNALQVPERVRVTVNPQDIVLRVYPSSERRNANEALGLVGPIGMGPNSNKVFTTNVNSALGRRHGSSYHMTSPLINGMIRYELNAFDEAQ